MVYFSGSNRTVRMRLGDDIIRFRLEWDCENTLNCLKTFDEEFILIFMK